MDSKQNITIMLKELSDGNKKLVDDLMPLLYNELHDLARRQLNRERKDHTLNATALINEAYMKLVDQNQVNWQDRSHFLGVSALVMKRILINYAKQRVAHKRGGGDFAVTFNEELYNDNLQAEEILDLEIALEKLAEHGERYAKVIELKFFGGLSMEEISEVLKVSLSSVKRDWKFSRAWLANQLNTGKIDK